MGALETVGTNWMVEAVPAIFILIGLFLMVWGVIRYFNALIKSEEMIPKIGEKIVIADASAYPFIKSGDTATVIYRNVKLKTVGVHAGDWPDRDSKYKELYPDSVVLIFDIEEVCKPAPEKKIDIGIQGVQEFEDALDKASKEFAELVADDVEKPVEPGDTEQPVDTADSDRPVEPGDAMWPVQLTMENFIRGGIAVEFENKEQKNVFLIEADKHGLEWGEGDKASSAVYIESLGACSLIAYGKNPEFPEENEKDHLWWCNKEYWEQVHFAIVPFSAFDFAHQEIKLPDGPQVVSIDPTEEQKQAIMEAVSTMPQDTHITVIDPPKSNRIIALEAANANRKATAYAKACCIVDDIEEGMSLQDAADKYDFANVKYLVRSVRKQGLEDPREVAKRVQAEAKVQKPGEPAQCAAVNAG